MSDINWGEVSGKADVMTPGETAGDSRCEAEQFGLPVGDVIVFGDLAGLRKWLTSALEQLPPERHGAPLVTVDRDRMAWWLTHVVSLYGADDPGDEPWEATIENLGELFEALSEDPGDAGWYRGEEVTSFWSEFDDDDGGLMVGVKLTHRDLLVGIGEPIQDEDLTPQQLLPGLTPEQFDDHDLALAALDLLATRINNSY